MNKNQLILALASSCLLVSCGVGEKEITFSQAKETASEILKVVEPKDFKKPTKITGVLSSKGDGSEATMTFVSDSENYLYYEKMESKDKDESTGEYINYHFEKWAYKEGNSFITAGILAEGEKSYKYYRNDLSWSPTYTPDYFIRLGKEFLKEVAEAETEEAFLEEAENYTSVKFKSSGKGNIVIEAKNEESVSLDVKIEDNLPTYISMTSDGNTESFEITYGIAEFQKPELTGFELVTLQ